jgi:hypothetical protein
MDAIMCSLPKGGSTTGSIPERRIQELQMKQVWNGPVELSDLLIPIEELKLDPKNLRKHGDRDLAALASSLAEFGQAKPIVTLVDKTVIAGNGTLEAAKRNGWTHLACVPFKDEKKARAYGVADNRTGDLSSFNDKLLAEALEEMNADGILLESVGFTFDEMMEVVGAVTKAQEEALAVTERLGQQPEPSKMSGIDTVSKMSHVKMVQLFFNEDTHPVFMERVKELAKVYAAEDITEAVFMAIEKQFEGLKG